MALTSAQPHTIPLPTGRTRGRSVWRVSSLGLIFVAWAALQLGGLFRPGLLDDVDSVYIQIAREMLLRHDWVTPTIDGIRFFDKPPLLYWMAAGSMHLFGVHDWAARLPLALGVLALLFAVYALGNRLFASISPPEHADRGGLYAAIATATSLGPYLYTRFYIPDILIALWMTLSVHLFLIALDRIREQRSCLLPSLGFAAVMALDVLTKGLIGIVFPLAFVLLYLLFTRGLRLLARLHLAAASALFLLLAAPWHILVALRNPPIAMPAGVGLPARAGWTWFYLYNEHIARFLGRRIPHDYGQVPIPLFWFLLLLWLFPWVAWLPAALRDAIRNLRRTPSPALRLDPDRSISHQADREQTYTPQTEAAPSWSSARELWGYGGGLIDRRREAALSLLLWPGIILGFFTLSSRQEYYHLPALPALALLVGGLLAAADAAAWSVSPVSSTPLYPDAGRLGADRLYPSRLYPSRPDPRRPNPRRQVLRGSLYFLVPLGSVLFLVCGYFAIFAPQPHPGLTLNDVLRSNPGLYNLSLGHVFDLTGRAMGFFRGPLMTVSLCMLILGPLSHGLRRGGAASRPSRGFTANLLVAAAMTGVLLAAHAALVRFYPILGSKGLALAIDSRIRPGDLIAIDGELTAGSTLLFYSSGIGDPATGQHVLLVNGRRNGPWFGSFWPDAPKIFLDDNGLRRLWAGPHRIFLLTYDPERRTADLSRFGIVVPFAESGGKRILTNRATED